MQSDIDRLTRPIIGMENRTPLEVFDIMCDRIRRALTAATAAREGWVLVPREATKAMLNATSKAMSPGCRPTPDRVSVNEKHRIRYSAMIAAAPPPPSDMEEG